jgi:hypothetical protein
LCLRKIKINSFPQPPLRSVEKHFHSWKRGISPATKLSSRLPRRAVGPERSEVERSAVSFLLTQTSKALRSFHRITNPLQRGVIVLPVPVFLVLFLLNLQFKQRDVCLVWIAEREGRNQPALRHQVFTGGATICKSA